MTKIDEIIFRLRQFNSEVIQDIADDLEKEIAKLLKKNKRLNKYGDKINR